MPKLEDSLSERQARYPSRHGDRALRLFNDLITRLPAQARERIGPAQICVAEIGLDTPELYIETFDDDRHLIVVHSGLLDFLEYVSVGLFSRISFSSLGQPHLSTDSRDAVRFIADGVWLLRETGRSPVVRGKPWGAGGLAIGAITLTSTQVQFAQLMTINALSYLIAHELGHLCTAIEGVDDELVADYLATLFVLQSSHESDGEAGWLWDEAAYRGAQFVHFIFDLLQRLGFPLAGTHPPPTLRLSFVREAGEPMLFTDAGSQPTRGLGPLAPLFDAIIAALEQSDIDQYHDAHAAEVASAASLFFSSFGNVEDVDRDHFYAEATRILELGYYHVLRQSAVAAAEELVSELTDHLTPIERKERMVVRINMFLDWLAFRVPSRALCDCIRDPFRQVLFRGGLIAIPPATEAH